MKLLNIKLYFTNLKPYTTNVKRMPTQTAWTTSSLPLYGYWK